MKIAIFYILTLLLILVSFVISGFAPLLIGATDWFTVFLGVIIIVVLVHLWMLWVWISIRYLNKKYGAPK